MNIQPYEINAAFLCQCGAVTIEKTDSTGVSCMQENLEKYFNIDFNDFKKILTQHDIPLHECYICNHCINHWGIDICICGSGEPVNKCDCGEHKGCESYNL